MSEGQNDPATEPATATEKDPWFSRINSRRGRLLDTLSKWSGGRIPSARLLNLKSFHHPRDAENNAEARPEPHQHVETRALWVTEAYTPATIGALMASLERIARKGGSRGHQDPAAWMRAQRHRDGSSLELYLSPPGVDVFLSGFKIEFPAFARSAHGTLWSATPSLTLLTITFELIDEERHRFDAILHGDHPTRFVANQRDNSISVLSPDLERRRLIRETRARWRKEAAAWFGTHFPGLLHWTDEGLPTAEFTTLTGAEPFSARTNEKMDKNAFKLLSALGMKSGELFVRAKDDQPDLRFAPFPDFHDDEHRHGIFAATAEAYESIPADHYGSGDARHLHAIDDSLRPMMAQWAIFALLRHFEDRAASARDRFAQMIGGARATRALARVRRDTADCADAAMIAREVDKGVKDRFLLARGVDMMSRPYFEDQQAQPMRKLLGDAMQRSARELVIQLKELNDALHSQAALLSAHANQRLQFWIILLAIVSAIAGALAAIEPVSKLMGSEQTIPKERVPPPNLPKPKDDKALQITVAPPARKPVQ